MVLFVLCFGVELLCCLGLVCVFIVLVEFGWLSDSACGVFSKYKYLVVGLVFSHLGFLSDFAFT